MYLPFSTGGTAAAPTHAEAIVPATAPAEAAADEKAADIIAEAEFVQKHLLRSRRSRRGSKIQTLRKRQYPHPQNPQHHLRKTTLRCAC